MTRKHFIAMANSISEMANVEARKEAAEAFVKVARTVNPRFNEAKFLAACGL